MMHVQFSSQRWILQVTYSKGLEKHSLSRNYPIMSKSTMKHRRILYLHQATKRLFIYLYSTCNQIKAHKAKSPDSINKQSSLESNKVKLTYNWGHSTPYSKHTLYICIYKKLTPNSIFIQHLTPCLMVLGTSRELKKLVKYNKLNALLDFLKN